MSADIVNEENIINDSKANEIPKSPGRLAAEERAERIRYAEEYRRKLEEEKGAVQPKKTKAAEQKEQAKLEKIAQEHAEMQEILEARRQEHADRISAAIEKITSLSESIEKTEAASRQAALEVTYEIPEPSQREPVEYVKAAPPEPVKLEENLTVNIPVQSFEVPCAVKYTQPEEDEEDEEEQTEDDQQYPQYAQYVPYPQPVFYPVYMPPVYIPVPANAPAQPQIIIQQHPQGVEILTAPTAKRNPVLPINSETIARRRPKPVIKSRPTPKFDRTNDLMTVQSDPFYRPAISYGTVVTKGGWESEIPDDTDDSVQNSTPQYAANFKSGKKGRR